MRKVERKTKAKSKIPYVIVRAQKAGVHAGELASSAGGKVRLRNARRIWYWAGAATLSELAVYGSSSPDTCKFPPAVAEMWIPIADVGEVIYCRPAGEKMIRNQAEWRA